MARNITAIIATWVAIVCTAATPDSPMEFTIVPPSPEVASLIKYNNIDISPFSGQPNINLPIYTVREGSIELPISISYHGGGIKVGEQSGIVGIGWTLLAGGSISRTVYGLPDETGPNESTFFRGVFNLDENTKAMRDTIMSRPQDMDYTVSQTQGEHILSYQQCHLFNEGLRDVANDVFHLSCNGVSGTFIYNPSDISPQMIFSPESPAQICPMYCSSGALPTEYNVVDGNGTKYLFGTEKGIEYTTSFHRRFNSASEFADSIISKSAWHLQQMVSITGDTISFSYERGRRQRVSLGVSDYCYVIKATDSNAEIQTGTSYNTATYTPLRLTSINSRSVIVEFIYDETKEILKSIIVKKNSETKDILQQFVFSHSSVAFSSTNKTILDKLEQKGTSGATIPLYQFNYHAGSTAGNSIFMSQDHWGFYNGVSNATTIYTEFPISGVRTGNRMPNETYTKCGVLESITYPTGGTTTLEWEPHEYSYIKSVRLSPYTTRDTTITTRKLSGKQSYAITAENITSITESSMNISVANEAWLTIDMSHYMADGMADALPWTEFFRVHYEAESIDQLLQTYPRVEVRSPSNELIDFWYIDESECATTKSLNVTTPGIYTLKICNPVNFEGATINSINGFFGDGADSNSDGFGYVTVQIKNISATVTTNYAKPWGGLRIAKITSNPADGASIVKQWSYQQGSPTALYSSGTISEEPSYHSTSYKSTYDLVHQNIVWVETFTETDGYHSSGLYSSPKGGSHIEYPEVWELYPDEDVMIRYNYDSQRTYPDVVKSSVYGFIPGSSRMNTSMSHWRGNLLRKTHYKSNNAHKVESFDYRILEAQSTPNFCGDFFRVLNVDGLYDLTVTGEPVSSDYITCIYNLYPFNKNISSTYVYEDVEGPTDFDFATWDYGDTISYTYFNEGYSEIPIDNYPRSKSVVNSKGQVETTYYTYLYVDNVGWTALPETEVTVCDGIIISGTKMVYDENNRLIATYNCESGIEAKNSYDIGNSVTATTELLNLMTIPSKSMRYNRQGNIIEVTYKGVPVASYLWSYQGAHPVAEIRGIGYDEMCAILPTNLSPAALLDRYDLTENELSLLRTLFPQNNVTTITYHWLVGVATTTDSRGTTMRYNFDQFGRVDNEKDYNNYFIRKYEYNYKN